MNTPRLSPLGLTNLQAFLIEHGEGEAVEFVGNRTECALLMLLRRLGIDYTAVGGSCKTTPPVPLCLPGVLSGSIM